MKKIKNTVHLTGKAGTEPVVINFTGGKKLARVSIAINESYKEESGETVQKTEWFNLVFWNEKVNLIEGILKKGAEISVQGKLSNQQYVDKAGNQQVSTEIKVFEVLNLETTENG